MDQPKFLTQLIKLLFFVLFFLTPFIFLPWTSELFEFNKMIFVYSISSLILMLWLLHIPMYRRFPFTWTWVHPFLILFIITQVIATFISIDPHTSVWGYYSRFNGGLASLLAYTTLFAAFATFMLPNPTKIISTSTTFHPILYTTITSGVLVAAYGIAQHFRIDEDKWKQDVVNRVFSTLGQPNWLAAYLVILLPITWYFAVRPFTISRTYSAFKWKRYFKPKRLFIYISTAILYLCLLYTRSRSGYIAFAISYVFFWTLLWISRYTNFKVSLDKLKSTLPAFIILTSIYIILSLTSSTPFSPSIQDYLKPSSPPESTATSTNTATPEQGGTESGEIRKIVWKGAWELGKQYPLTGTGVETFAYSYYWTRPREHNDVSEWDFLYNKAHNEYLNFWATTGAIGTGAYLLLLGAIGYFWLKNFLSTPGLPNPLRTQIIAFGSAWLTILITNFFGFSVVLINLFFYVLPALMLISKPSYRRRNFKIPAIPALNIVGYTITIIIFLTLTKNIFNIFSADLYYSAARKSHRQNDLISAQQLIDKATQIRPTEPVISNYASAVATDLSIHAFFNNEATLAATLKDNAITYSNIAVTLNPYHINFWKDRTAMFINLITLDPNLLTDAIHSLEVAQELAPTDPKIPYNLALLHARKKEYPKAIEYLNHTLALKPNYHDALYALAVYYHQSSINLNTGEITDPQGHQTAIDYLQQYIEITPPNPEITQRLAEWQSESTRSDTNR